MLNNCKNKKIKESLTTAKIEQLYEKYKKTMELLKDK